MSNGTQVRVDYAKIRGGLDLVSPALSIDPGRPIYAMNYEANHNGGLSRIDGYERFDGRTKPSDSTYHYCTGVFYTGDVLFGGEEFLFGGEDPAFGAVAHDGDTIAGVTSSATGLILAVDSDEIAFITLTGTFVADEEITIDGVSAGIFSGAPVASAAPTAYPNAVYKNQAADYYREFIAKPPGSGPVRGGGKLGTTIYVFRDNAGATACNLWKSSTSGWTQVTLLHEISFDTGSGYVYDGDTVEQDSSGATATVSRVVIESGDLGTDAAGRLILSDIDGDFDSFGALIVDGTNFATATSVATQITIAPGGRYETFNYNFYGLVDTYRMYGCSGVDRGFEFDGTVYVPINTGMSVDAPSHAAGHKKQLFFSFSGSLQNSTPGNPFSWTAVTGASEIGIGDDITGLNILPGKVLGVMGTYGSYQLVGSTVDDFELDTISADAGGLPYTTQNVVGATLTFGDFGINKVTASADYGNFSQATVSRDVQPLVDDMKSVVVGSTIYRSRNQYRLFGSDGTGICLTSATERAGLDYANVFYITNFKYPVNAYSVFATDDDETFVCSDDGWVFQADKGSSFDGEEIEAYFHLAFNHSKSPTTIKSYLKAVVEVKSDGYTEIKLFPDFSYSDPRYDQHIVKDAVVDPPGGRWNVSAWETFYWDSKTVSSVEMPLRGNGENIAIIGYSSTDLDVGHRVDSVVVHYLPRRINR